MNFRVICFILSVTIVCCQQTSYRGYKVWNVTTQNAEQQKLIHSWKYISGIDFWEEVAQPGIPMRIMVTPHVQMEFGEFLNKNKILNEIIIEDVETLFEEERKQLSYKAGTFQLNHFWSTNEINDYITYLTTHYGDICQQKIVSTSIEGRLMHGFKVAKHKDNESKPIVLFDAGVHAREWIAPMTAIYFMQQLVENSAQYADILDKVDIMFIPMMNPDGYEFSRSNNRMWRKNRARNGGALCLGVDCNRNYPHMWESSSFTCSEAYPGRGPFSEPETQALRNVIAQYGHRVKLYVSLHSYGKYLLYPWGYDYKLIENWEEHESVGKRFGSAIYSSTGTNYSIGNSAYLLYPANGASDDYAASTGINLAYTLELPGGGRNGFDLPANQIDPVTKETWIGMQEILRYVANKRW